MACGRVVGCDLQKSNRPLRYIGSFKDALNHLIAEAYEDYNRAEAGSLPGLGSPEAREEHQISRKKKRFVLREMSVLQGDECPDMNPEDVAYRETYRQEAANGDEAFKEDLIVLFSFLRDLTEDDKKFINKVDTSIYNVKICNNLFWFFDKMQSALVLCPTERSSRLMPWLAQCELVDERIALRRELQYQEEQKQEEQSALRGPGANCCRVM